jgi:tripartite-type tricarboxylate transporter receptor subunit TctC
MQTRLTRRRLLSGIGCGAVSAAAMASGATPARAADFYLGKSLTLIVGYAPGGGVDATARTIAQHFVRFIPGQPNVVVQNMEGAAGVIATNYLARRVAPDGLTLAVPGRSWFLEGIVKSPGIVFDPAKLTYVGSPGGVNSALFVRTATGIGTVEQLKSATQPLTVGALGSTTPTAMVPAMLAAEGWPIKVVLGYVSTARVMLALEQGEVDGFFTAEDSFGSRQDLLGKVVVPVLQAAGRHPGVALLRDVVPPADRPLLELVLATDSFGVPLVGPPGMPPELVDILRKAFVAMAGDPSYQADAVKVDLPIGSPIGGDELADKIDALTQAATPEIVSAYKRLAKK